MNPWLQQDTHAEETAALARGKSRRSNRGSASTALRQHQKQEAEAPTAQPRRAAKETAEHARLRGSSTSREKTHQEQQKNQQEEQREEAAAEARGSRVATAAEFFSFLCS